MVANRVLAEGVGPSPCVPGSSLNPWLLRFRLMRCTCVLSLLTRMDKALGRAVEGVSAAGYRGSSPLIITHHGRALGRDGQQHRHRKWRAMNT